MNSNNIKETARRLWLGSLVLCAAFFQPGHSQENEMILTAVTDSSQCPPYRFFDTNNPTSSQYEAPDGCRCVDGMGGMKCNYCDSNAPCQAGDGNENNVCRKDMIFAKGDAYKAYSCSLFSTLALLFNNGKVDLVADLTTGTGLMTVYDTGTVNGGHAVECRMSGCDFPVEGTNAFCTSTVCKCTDRCDDFSRGIVDAIDGKPAELLVSDHDGYSSHLSVKMEGVPFDIEALCNASACTEEVEVVEDFSLKEVDSTWSASASFSLMVLFVMLGIFILLSFCICSPLLLCANLRKREKYQHADQSGFVDAENYTDDNNSDDSNDANNGITNSTSRRSTKRHVLEFHHLSRTVKLRSDQAKVHGSSEKHLVNNVSGKVKSGTLCAIMGPSGAGKSSLLNILAAVEGSNSRISGQILLNKNMQIGGYRKAVAYVQQDDSLYGTLTVLECIEYSAMLRLPKNMSATEKQAEIWKTINELHLSHIAHNRIGSADKAGVSGGERKRVSIGMELVSRATLLMLDEPTSGLDSHAANSLIKTLSELASKNRIVILSIHQPSMKSFLSMDKILLLGAGRVMYDGKPSQVEAYLNGHGFPRPPMESVADHMLEVVSSHENCLALQGPDVCQEDYQYLLDLNNSVGTSMSWQDEEASDSSTSHRSREGSLFINEIPILFIRTAKDIFRNRELFIMQLTISFCLALFGGGIFSNVSDDLAGFQNRMGAFYFCLSFFAFSSFSSMETFVSSRNIFVRETGSKYHGVFSYYFAKSVLDMMFLRVIPVTIFTFFFYWMMGLRREPETFVVFWTTLVLFNICAGTISICISIATSTVSQANLVAAVWFLVMLLFGGFLVNVDSMAPWYSWLRYISIFYYSFEILMTNELSGLVINFNAPGYPSLPVYGEVFLKSIGMDINNQLRDLVCLCFLCLGFSLSAYLLLLLRVPSSAATLFKMMRKENSRLLKAEAAAAADDEEAA